MRGSATAAVFGEKSTNTRVIKAFWRYHFSRLRNRGLQVRILSGVLTEARLWGSVLGRITSLARICFFFELWVAVPKLGGLCVVTREAGQLLRPMKCLGQGAHCRLTG